MLWSGMSRDEAMSLTMKERHIQYVLFGTLLGGVWDYKKQDWVDGKYPRRVVL